MAPNLVDYLLYEPEDSGILWIKFNRPERMNALIGSSEENGTVAKVGEYMRAGDDDPKVRVIVLTGVGRGFCSGADMRRDTPAEMIEVVRLAEKLGVVCRDRIDEVLNLARIAGEMLAIGAEAIHVERAQAARQPAVD